MAPDRAGWPDAVLTAWPAQTAGVYAARWWRDTGGEACAVQSRAELLAALGVATMGFILCRHLDPDAVEAIELCTGLGIPFRQAVEGAYPMPVAERIAYIGRAEQRERFQASQGRGLRAA
jgi:hypothetical protein